MRNQILTHLKSFFLALLLSLAFAPQSTTAQTKGDSLMGTYVGERRHYTYGYVYQYSVPDTIYVYKASGPDSLLIKTYPLTNDQKKDQLERDSARITFYKWEENVYRNRRLSYFEEASFYNNDSIAFRSIIENSGGLQEKYLCKKLTTTGISEGPRPSIFKLYPNPVTTNLHLQGTHLTVEFSYQILNTHGKIMDQGLLKENINVSSLPQGLYYLQISGSTGTAVKRFLKQ